MTDPQAMNEAQVHASRASEEGSAAIRAELSALRAEIASIREGLSDFGSETYAAVRERAGTAAAYVQEETSSVAGVIREHPATATTLMTLVGGIGFAIGYLVASTSLEQKQAWYRRYYS
ncbi:hypothetical protein SAMN05880590_111135 [Rhizobium sp. RU35A]|uniref:Uncharacterized protein n=1 Tax=Rhizobium straminoryzae TaxID=1387186 RepID=A0A549T3N0_9HYPH|nr:MULTISPECIES: hypothetical protein [Rhizobium]TRL36495.1 hypothetical protein FNA46_17755 [Rhizobium straminoryzae]SIR07502.1 hypothetical protein SAMN05880590_111135 [Rhizobium sp. RU35A]